jgi:hypothetical protein
MENRTMNNTQWTTPAPRKGLSGAWDRFVGPGATPAEEWLQLGGGLLLTGLLGVLLYLRRDSLNWSTLQAVIAAFLILDLTGGILTNATSAAKRWYHRAGQDSARAHLPFIAVHGVHLLVVAAAFRGGDVAFFAVAFAYLLIAAVIIIRAPLYLQRPVAFGLFCGGVLLGMYVFSPTPGLEWFIPFFYLKLLVSHLVRETPFAPDKAFNHG